MQHSSSRLFEPSTAGAAFEDRLAFELAGEGFVEPTVAGAYRKVYLERTWAVALASAVQTAVAGAMLALRLSGGQTWEAVADGGARRCRRRVRSDAHPHHRLREPARQPAPIDIDTWKRMHNWQEKH